MHDQASSPSPSYKAVECNAVALSSLVIVEWSIITTSFISLLSFFLLQTTGLNWIDTHTCKSKLNRPVS